MEGDITEVRMYCNNYKFCSGLLLEINLCCGRHKKYECPGKGNVG